MIHLDLNTAERSGEVCRRLQKREGSGEGIDVHLESAAHVRRSGSDENKTGLKGNILLGI
jgi:hypothetical protein